MILEGLLGFSSALCEQVMVVSLLFFLWDYKSVMEMNLVNFACILSGRCW